MRRLVAATLLLLAAATARAEVSIPEPALVVDQAGLLSAAERFEVESALRIVQHAEKGADMAILVVDTIPGGDLEGYSLAVARAWKLGRQGRNDGLLLVHAVKDRRYRFEVGIGLQGEINDAAIGDIGREALVPGLQANDHRAAYLGAIAAVSARLGGPAITVPAIQPRAEPAASPVEPAAPANEDIPAAVWVMLACAVVGGVLFHRNFWLVLGVPAPVSATILTFMTLPPGDTAVFYGVFTLLIAGFIAMVIRNPLILVEIFFRVLAGGASAASSSSSRDSSSTSSSGGSFDGGGASGKY